MVCTLPWVRGQVAYVYVFVAVFRLFKKSQCYTNPAVMAGITMPCLKIMNGLIYPKDVKKVRAGGRSF